VDEWEDVLPERHTLIQKVGAHSDALIVEYLKNASSKLCMYALDGSHEQHIELPGEHVSVHAVVGPPEATEVSLVLSSYHMPQTVYRLSLASAAVTKEWHKPVPVDTDRMTVKQEWFRSRDGTPVSMFVVHRTDIERDGKRPTLVWGYGGFQIAMTPAFKTHAMPLIEQGGVYVEVNLRGGDEYGEEWHQAARRQQKQNVFDDCIAAIETLFERNYTNSDRLALFGWSNGGLLTSAVMTQRPELLRAAIIGTPVADMLRYHTFQDSGRNWITEYGDPDDPSDAAFLGAYSPLHNVTEANYPATLILTADEDDRVHPSHAYKMTAALQDHTTADHPVLARIETKAGHGGARARSKHKKRFAAILGFLFQELHVSYGESQRASFHDGQ